MDQDAERRDAERWIGAQRPALERMVGWPAEGKERLGSGLGRQLGQQGRLVVAKGRLAMLLEKAADAAAQALLQQVVHVDEGQAQAPGELPAHGGFAAAGHADQGATRLHACVFVSGER